MRRLWRLFLAYWRLSESAICEMSVGRDAFNDFHDYPDDADGIPWHWGELKCKCCGKVFQI